ncbi:hypothetical protein T02_15347 [Trichinella nativa]|uniref:CCHC-type domain-containing protein n=1 Tax=Trichinella nativa TaxID=6335 RepID=A0A0V1KLN4_9BILA|nr:hypothetical protein T02_15347 [Trichinella nativa]
MKLETTKRRQQIEQRRLRDAIIQVLKQLETDSNEIAVTNALSALDAQYAEARRAQVFETRNQAGIFLKEKGNGPAVNPKQSSSLTFAAEQFESSIHQQEGLNDITKLLHLRSCLSGSALKAIEGVTICAENYPEVVQTLKTRFYRIPDVVESHVLSVMNVKACSNEGAGELTRLHDDLNRHFLELKALGKDVNCGLSGFHVILPTLTRKLPSGTVTEWKTFVKNKKDDKIHSDVFLAFLLEHARIKDTDIGSRTKTPTKGHQQEPYHNARKPDLRFTTAAVQMEPGGGCPVCKGDHLADCCPRFRSYSVQQRRHWAMQLKLCFVCLAQGHRRERCEKRKSNQFWNPLLAGDAVLAGKAPTKRASSAARSPGIVPLKQRPCSLGIRTRRSKMDLRKEPPLSKSISLQLKVRPQSGCQSCVRWRTERKGKRSWSTVCWTPDQSDHSSGTMWVDLQGPTRAMTVKGVNGLHVRIADVRRVQFRLTPIPSKGLESFNEGIELTALSLPNLCDDLVATPTPWFCKDKIPSLP